MLTAWTQKCIFLKYNKLPVELLIYELKIYDNKNNITWKSQTQTQFHNIYFGFGY